MSAIESVPFAYEAGGEKYRGAFVARGGVEPSAACVLLPDWRGQSALAHDHARFLVEHGCAVVIGDLYDDGFSPTDPSQVGEMVKPLMENRERGVEALAELYGQSHHAFDNPDVGTDPTKRLVYSAAAAERSRHAIADFIRERTSTIASPRTRARAKISVKSSEAVDKGKIHATWFVVPRSGTGELTGLRGRGGFEGDFGQGSDGTLDYWFE